MLIDQVNGLRGETETLDKMRARVQYDIDTMRNWSLLSGMTRTRIDQGARYKLQG